MEVGDAVTVIKSKLELSVLNLSSLSSINMMSCFSRDNNFAKKTVARIDNYEYLLPKNKEFFKKLGVDSLIYPEMLAAKEIVSSIRMSWVRQWWEFCGG